METPKYRPISPFKALLSPTWWRIIREYLGLRKSSTTKEIYDSQSLECFVNSRASLVAQSCLYDYLKTRAGTRFPEMFENPGLLVSMNIAKWQIWLACVSDLSVYIGGLIAHQGNVDNEKTRQKLLDAMDSMISRIDDNDHAEHGKSEFLKSAEAVRIRLLNTDFAKITDDEMAFSQSTQALYYWAPIDTGLKKRDETIIRNSIRFKWQEIRRTIRKSLNVRSLMEGL